MIPMASTDVISGENHPTRAIWLTLSLAIGFLFFAGCAMNERSVCVHSTGMIQK
jgi:hypothetical protein